MRLKYGCFLMLILIVVASAHSLPAAEIELKFRAEGTFKILLMSDLHNGSDLQDPNTAHCIPLMERLIDLEKPDFVVVNGDVALGDLGPQGETRKKAVALMAGPMEKAKVPWAITLGNHDTQFPPDCGITRADVMGYYESYPHNINSGWARGITGVGNKNILIMDSAGKQPVFDVWLIDSNHYPKTEQLTKDLRYDWIHTDQVIWYYQTSKALEAKYGQRIPGLMFCHIPLLECAEMAINKKTVGERHERESSSLMNGGMFAAVFDRGDVKGIFFGHDHINNYMGLWHGIQLGFDGCAGYNGYPHTDPDDQTNDRARGGRVFLIRESDPTHFRTWMRFRDGTTNWESWTDAYLEDQLKMDVGPAAK